MLAIGATQAAVARVGRVAGRPEDRTSKGEMRVQPSPCLGFCALTAWVAPVLQTTDCSPKPVVAGERGVVEVTLSYLVAEGAERLAATQACMAAQVDRVAVVAVGPPTATASAPTQHRRRLVATALWSSNCSKGAA